MILRRVIEHVKDQNWTAVALEFVIVVVGVFLGIQVANWNEDRAFSKREREYLVQLRDEVAQNQRVTEHQAAYVKAVVEAGRRALSYLESDRECADDCADLLIDFFHASQVWGTPRTVTIYSEMERLGLPREQETRNALQDMYRFLDGWDFVNLAPPAYRENVRGYFSPEASEVMWRDCYYLPDDELERLVRDCIDELRGVDGAAMLERMRTSPELANQLRFWIGQNLFAMGQFPDARRFADNAMAAIDEALEQ